MLDVSLAAAIVNNRQTKSLNWRRSEDGSLTIDGYVISGFDIIALNPQGIQDSDFVPYSIKVSFNNNSKCSKLPLILDANKPENSPFVRALLTEPKNAKNIVDSGNGNQLIEVLGRTIAGAEDFKTTIEDLMLQNQLLAEELPTIVPIILQKFPSEGIDAAIGVMNTAIQAKGLQLHEDRNFIHIATGAINDAVLSSNVTFSAKIAIVQTRLNTVFMERNSTPAGPKVFQAHDGNEQFSARLIGVIGRFLLAEGSDAPGRPRKLTGENADPAPVT